MEYLLYGLIFYALLFLVRYFLIFRQLIGLRLQYSQYEQRSENDLPDYLKDPFAHTVQQLEPLGFQLCCYMEVDSMVQDFGKRWDLLLYNENLQTFATAQINAIPDAANLFALNFYSLFEDGEILLTINARSHELIAKLPNTILQDPYASTLEEHWQAHKNKFEELKTIIKTRHISLLEFIELLQFQDAAYIDSLVSSGEAIRQKGTAFFYLTLPTAIKAAIAFVHGSSKSSAFLKKRTALAKTMPAMVVDIPVEVEVEAYQRFERYQRREGRKNFKLWFLLGSLGVFILAFTPLFDWHTLAILIGVLFFHEAGHFLAMRIFKYKDTSIFFLPFFGAAASGHKDDATLTEKVLVLLAGPLPGLLLGAAIGMTMQGNLYDLPGAFPIVTWLLSLNYLNLLPILPLDGGRVLNLLVFSRHPFTDVGFKIVTVCFFLLLAVKVSDPISLPLGILTAITIPASFRSAKMLKQLQRQRQFENDQNETVLHSLFRTLRQTGYKSLPFVEKYRLVKDLAQRCNESNATWATRLWLLGLYLVCLIGGLVLVFLTFVPSRHISAVLSTN